MIKKVGFIGAGNVAWHIAIAMEKSGVEVSQIISRTKESAKELASKVGAKHTDSLHKMSPDIDIWIIAIPDDVISVLVDKFPFKPKSMVHTSGSVGMSVLKGKAENIGIFYPLQTFSKERVVNMQEVPLCLEAEEEGFYRDLEALARRITSKIYSVGSKERRELHLAAVFACNFTNSLYSIAEDLLEQKDLPFEILHPLIKETAQKAIDYSPKTVQTGPAVRNDQVTMKNHSRMLKSQEYQELYKLLSNIIKEQK